MAEIDFQMALLLQHKFEQESRRKKLHNANIENDYRLALALQQEGTSKSNFTPTLTDSDRELALQLQEDFKREAEIERPSNNLVYKHPKDTTNPKCLVDPSWEVIDPTPDVHVLFIAFNDKFFWGTLGSVTVSWSKRMTTCAGICSYQGRGGMCSITLSEPLLKLRPRKDLVETLLHEMIHAYLFVTDNNRDRDGHGPEFHKHMYRINAEAGTNITVYHDFHDEVKLYQQHWWRCDGPCQQKKPYFGMVRRAMNRPPGPNDRWWGDHQTTCGGTFVKVKEPVKPEAKTNKKVAGSSTKNPTPTPTKNDIRNYIPVQNKASTSKDNKENEENKIKANTNSNNLKSNIIDRKADAAVKPSNVHGILNKNSKSEISNVIPSKVSNIHGFTNLSTPSNTANPNNKKTGFGGIKGATKNAGSSTFVVNNKNNKTSTKTTDDAKPSALQTTVKAEVFSGVGRKLSNSTTSELDYSVARNHWLQKFENDNKDKHTSFNGQTKNGSKRTNSMPNISPQKVPRLSLASQDVSMIKSDPLSAQNSSVFSENDLEAKSQCPICETYIPINELDAHLDNCLDKKDSKECIICSKKINSNEYELHVLKCCEEKFNTSDEAFVEQKKCTKCDKMIENKYFDSHWKHCGNDLVDLTNYEPSTSHQNSDNKNCPVCKESLDEYKYDLHVEKCLLNMFDNLEEKYDIKTDKKTSCLACGKEILKSELDSHLEDCMNMSNVFDTTNVPIVEEDENGDKTVKKSTEDSFNCPFCLKLILEMDMQAHLDKCLSENGSEEAENNKNVFLSSFSEDDS